MDAQSVIVTAILVLNLVLVGVSIWYFTRIFSVGKGKTLTVCWKLIMAGVLLFVLETVLTLLRTVGVLNMPRMLNGLFEMVILCLFIYVVLFQRTAIMSAIHHKEAAAGGK